ncbi:MAG: CPBP family intramembrane metalloprotease [Cytophagales bacterium]|nr:MAG: CPBP family intramembrane metalloprotease [Cytophagales bacterium]
MRTTLNNIHHYLLQLNLFSLILCSSLFITLNTFLLSRIVAFFDIAVNGPKFESMSQEFILVVVAAPIVETFIFQILIFELLLMVVGKSRKGIALFMSAFLFGLSHYYSWIYVVSASLTGLVLGYVYIIVVEKKISPLWTVWSVPFVHSLVNLYVFLLSYINH